MSDIKVFMLPEASKSEGGIRRVVSALKDHLGSNGTGIHFVDSEDRADVCAFHAVDYTPTKKPIVCHTHGAYWKEYKWGKWAHSVNERVMRTALEAEVVISPTEWVADILRRELWVKPVVISHGVNIEEWPYHPDPDGNILWNKSRVDIICDPTPILELATRLRDVQFETTFSKGRLVYPNLRISGALSESDARSQVQRCGIYLATTRETFGIGTLEAMCSGKPVLGWDWAGQHEIVEHMRTGYLCRVGDYNDLVEGYHYIREHYMKLAAAARMVVEQHYQWKNIVKQYAALYHKAAGAYVEPTHAS